MPVIEFEIDGNKYFPTLGLNTWIAPDAWVIGNSQLGASCTILFGAVIRGDVLPIRIGSNTNIQDGVIVHTSTGLSPSVIGNNVTVGHRAIIHGCTIEDDCLIGMGATILDGAIIGKGSIIGAHALITKGIKIPPGSLVLGSPGKVIRAVTLAELRENQISAEHYMQKGLEYARLFGKNAIQTR